MVTREVVLGCMICLLHAAAGAASTRHYVGPSDSVAHLNLRDNDELVIDRGHVSHANAYDDSAARMHAGSVSHYTAYGRSTVFSEDMDIGFLNLHDTSQAVVQGGIHSWIRVYDEASVNVSNIDDLSWLLLEGTQSTAVIYATEATYANGHLSGVWEDGRRFEFWLLRSPNLSEGLPVTSELPFGVEIITVPEPGTMILGLIAMAFGGIRRQLAS